MPRPKKKKAPQLEVDFYTTISELENKIKLLEEEVIELVETCNTCEQRCIRMKCRRRLKETRKESEE